MKMINGMRISINVAEAIEGKLLYIGQAATSGTSDLDVQSMLRKVGREIIELAEEFERGEQEASKLVDWSAVCQNAIRDNENDFPELELSDATIEDMRETGRQLEAENLQRVRDETGDGGGILGGPIDRLEKAWEAATSASAPASKY